MLITAFLLIRPEGHREPRNEVGSLSLAERLVGFEPGTSDSNFNVCLMNFVLQRDFLCVFLVQYLVAVCFSIDGLWLQMGYEVWWWEVFFKCFLFLSDTVPLSLCLNFTVYCWSKCCSIMQALQWIFCVQALNYLCKEVLSKTAQSVLPALKFLGKVYNFCNSVIIDKSWWYIEEWHISQIQKWLNTNKKHASLWKLKTMPDTLD